LIRLARQPFLYRSLCFEKSCAVEAGASAIRLAPAFQSLAAIDNQLKTA
jgi:hypothetical protein